MKILNLYAGKGEVGTMMKQYVGTGKHAHERKFNF